MIFDGVEILAAEVYPGVDCGWTLTGDKTAVPTRIEATVFLADPLVRLELLVTADWAGRGLVRRMSVMTDGPQTGISITLLRRIPVDTIMRFAMNQATRPVTMRPDISERAFQLVGETGDLAWVSGAPAAPGRGRDTPTDRVVQAAEAYRQAVASGSRAPAEYVAKALGYSRATAARDIRLARKRKLLPPGRGSAASAPTEGGPGVVSDAAITGTGRVSRMSAEDFTKAADELGVQGPGPKGKRLADMTPDEFEELAIRLGAWERPTEDPVTHPGVPLDEGTE